MATSGFKITSNKAARRLTIRMRNMPQSFKDSVARGFQEWGVQLVRETQNSVLNERKYGRWYPDEIKKLHRASAAGQTPAAVFGDYFLGLDFKANGLDLEFGNTAKHAKYLERGTSRMKARPGMRNAIDKTTRNFRSYLNDELERTLGGR